MRPAGEGKRQYVKKVVREQLKTDNIVECQKQKGNTWQTTKGLQGRYGETRKCSLFGRYRLSFSDTFAPLFSPRSTVRQLPVTREKYVLSILKYI